MARPKIGARKAFHLYMDENVINAIHAIAAVKNTTPSELIRVACRDYLVREGAKAIAERTAIEEIRL